MEFVRNDRLVRRESRIGGVLLGITFAVLALGLFLSGQLEQLSRSPETPTWMPIAGSYTVVAVGMLLLILGNSRVRRYGPQYRQDERLRALLKGLDRRYSLVAFPNRRLPDYLLVGPGGVWILVTRPQRGEILCRSDRWSRRSNPIARVIEGVYGTGIGNPTLELGRGIQQVSAELGKRLPVDKQPPLNGAIVFTSEGVRLRIERSTYPVVTGKELRRVVGRQKETLRQGEISDVLTALRDSMQG